MWMKKAIFQKNTGSEEKTKGSWKGEPIGCSGGVAKEGSGWEPKIPLWEGQAMKVVRFEIAEGWLEGGGLCAKIGLLLGKDTKVGDWIYNELGQEINGDWA